jgi:hypothetical protein
MSEIGRLRSVRRRSCCGVSSICYRKPDGPTPTPQVELRLREGYKVVRMLLDCYDQATTRNWLFGTNSRLDDQAPIGVLRSGKVPEDFVAVVRAARQFASADV